MCTVTDGADVALVCDVALPWVRAALDADPAIAVEYQTHPTDGTALRLTSGDPTRFTELLRRTVEEANR